MEARRYGSTACESIPFHYTLTEEHRVSDGMNLFWYVLTDEHQVQINEFDTEQKAITFLDTCNRKEIGVLAMFYGRQVQYKKVEMLCPID